MGEGERVMFWKISAGLAVVVLGSAVSAQNLVQPDNSDAGLGQPLYAEYCAACHGVKLEGQENWQTPDADGILPAPPHDRTGHTWHHDDGLLFEYTKLGGAKTLELRGVSGFASGMAGFSEQLSDAEIWHVLAYIKSTWPAPIQTMQRERSQAEVSE